MNEIQEYCLHVTESEAEKDSIQYFIHNTETLYDISYYSNMIDIHVEDECSVSVNTFSSTPFSSCSTASSSPATLLLTPSCQSSQTNQVRWTRERSR